MEKKSNLFYRVMAIIFASAMSAASLRGCAYGPPPMPPETQKLEDKTSQNQDNIIIAFAESDPEIEENQ